MSLLDPTTPEGAEHRAWLEVETVRLLEFARGTAHPAGGFGWAERTGGLDPERGRQLWIGCRMVHCLALGALLGHEGYAAAAADGVAALRTAYKDDVNGGWWADADRPDEGRKEAYGHAFVILAGASATVAGIEGGRALLDEAMATYLERFWDDEAGMPFESWAPDWTDLEDYRGGNAAMHTLEAFLAAADATGDIAWRGRASRIAGRILDAATAYGDRIPEHFDANWEVLPDYNVDQPRHPFRPYGATPGHAFEWARLVLTLDAQHEVPASYRASARRLADTAWQDAWDAAMGGLVYTTDLAGVPVVRERFHWVECEAMGAAWALHLVTGDDVWSQRYDAVTTWSRRHLLDDALPGVWRHELSAQNEDVQTTWTGAPDVYHALQAVLLPQLPLAPGLALALRGR